MNDTCRALRVPTTEYQLFCVVLRVAHSVFLVLSISYFVLPCTVSRVSCHMYECVMSHVYVSRSKSRVSMCHVICMNASCHMYKCVMSHVWMAHVTLMNILCHTEEMSHVPSLYEQCVAL